MGILPAWLSVYHVHTWYPWRPLELQMVANHHVGAGNQIWVPLQEQAFVQAPVHIILKARLQ